MAASMEPSSEKLYGEDTLGLIQVHEFDIPCRQIFKLRIDALYYLFGPFLERHWPSFFERDSAIATQSRSSRADLASCGIVYPINTTFFHPPLCMAANIAATRCSDTSGAFNLQHGFLVRQTGGQRNRPESESEGGPIALFHLLMVLWSKASESSITAESR